MPDHALKKVSGSEKIKMEGARSYDFSSSTDSTERPHTAQIRAKLIKQEDSTKFSTKTII